jgi:Mg2+-importing ATPase
VVFLPFLPMLPVQILLNNLLYDISEIAIPMDRVDASTLARPRRWNMKFIRDFMLIFGPLSSVFDFATFAVLLGVFHADAGQFRTAWFVESLATQVLVIFVIRTSGSAFASRPHPLLVATSLSAVAIALLLPFTPVGVWFGFTPLPPAMLAALAIMGGLYLVVADLVKRRFYARHGLE